jgi:hypothetical protein
MTINYLARKPEWRIQDAGMRLAIELERARYSIWIANIWITNNELFELLIDKAKQGLTVEIILDKGVWMDCEDLSKLQRFIDVGGELYLTQDRENGLDLHNAFCIIDNSIAIDHESDNKTYKQSGYCNYFIREYPETLVEHYINEYFSVKKNCCLNRYS